MKLDKTIMRTIREDRGYGSEIHRAREYCRNAHLPREYGPHFFLDQVALNTMDRRAEDNDHFWYVYREFARGPCFSRFHLTVVDGAGPRLWWHVVLKPFLRGVPHIHKARDLAARNYRATHNKFRINRRENILDR